VTKDGCFSSQASSHAAMRKHLVGAVEWLSPARGRREPRR
jgi:hypothetical protein